MILSRNILLILDPHHGWTSRYPNPGGPVYDFVKNTKALNNQLIAFSPILKEFDKPFEGTVIRIPLRTSEQAKDSKICQYETTPSEIAKVMQDFAIEFRVTGLLFMKNVEEISITLGEEPPISIRIYNEQVTE
jgi:sacsin